jgi:cation transport ATPase
VSGLLSRAGRRLWSGRAVLLFALPAGLLLIGLAGEGMGARAVASVVWTAVTLLGLAYSTVAILVALRHRRPWVEAIAWLALVGALLVGESLTGAVIAVMLFTGGVLQTRSPARRDGPRRTRRDPDPEFAALPGDAWLSAPTVLSSQS